MRGLFLRIGRMPQNTGEKPGKSAGTNQHSLSFEHKPWASDCGPPSMICDREQSAA
jgi:hypothetical protein